MARFPRHANLQVSLSQSYKDFTKGSLHGGGATMARRFCSHNCDLMFKIAWFLVSIPAFATWNEAQLGTRL